MQPNQSQFTFNVGGDPILYNRTTPQNFIDNINDEIARLEEYKRQLNGIKIRQGNHQQAQQEESLWEVIDKEVSSLTDEQRAILEKDETYVVINSNLQFLINQHLIASVKDQVANTAQGKELLEKQLKYIKERKADIIKESNKELELFKQFQVAVQSNPELTYPEFIKSLNK